MLLKHDPHVFEGLHWTDCDNRAGHEEDEKLSIMEGSTIIQARLPPSSHSEVLVSLSVHHFEVLFRLSVPQFTNKIVFLGQGSVVT